ncbi:MAG: hypothetical protein DWQ01_17150 [Planctomycetota bacterium]|nr:MAG: hypothetical protein DWQ01_17150 [Planctomycetota bacterium]
MLNFVLFGLTALLAHGEPQTGSDLQLHSISSGGMTRYYRIHVPPSYQAGVPTPLVLAYHGGGGNARQFADSSNLNDASDRHGFLLVYPEGTGILGGWPFFWVETWNAGGCCGWAQENDIDDVGFTRDMLDDIESKWSVDPKAVFATGHSNGGMMSYRLGIELSDRIVAIGPNATCLIFNQTPPTPIPVIAFHGKLDCNVPFQGGLGCGISGVSMTSQTDSLTPFIQVNQAQVPQTYEEQRGDAFRIEFPAPATGADIRYWWMRDHGHAWPGHGSAIGDPFNTDIDINEELWLFFDQHRRP